MKNLSVRISILFLILFFLSSEALCRDYPLHRAARLGDINQLRILLDQSYDINTRDGNGYTALYSAAGAGQTETVKMLLQRGARTEIPDNFVGYTPLVQAAFSGHKETVKALIDGGANTDQAIARLEAYPSHSSDAYKAKAGIKLIQKLIPKEETASSSSISREDLKSIVQEAVEGAVKEKKKSTKASTASSSEIDHPVFSSAETIMGENDLAVIIGIEGYSSLPKSDYSFDDASLVRKYVRALGIRERNIEFITDEKATLSGLTKSLEVWLKNKAKDNSRVIVYYSGHGAPDPVSGESYLVPYDGDPDYLSVTGYPLKKLYSTLGRLNAKEVMIIIDACFSGSGGRSVLARGARPLVMMKETTSLPYPHLAVLTAAQANQISTSSPERGHGVFTYYFLKAIKDGRKNLSEIYLYMKPLVEDEAKALNVNQSPFLNPASEKVSGKFYLRK